MRTGLPVLAIVCLLALSVSTASADLPFEGELSYANGLGTYGYWDAEGTVLSWIVSETEDPEYGWNYFYSLTVPQHDVSYLVLEVSDNLTLDDINNVQGAFAGGYPWDLDDFDTGPSAENMPDTIHGIKFELAGEGPYTTLWFSFDCTRDPVWGDFYAKDGKDAQDPLPAALWNLGFTEGDADPTVPASGGSVAFHVLTPDTTVSSPGPSDDSPEPATWLLLAVTGVATGVARRRRK